MMSSVLSIVFLFEKQQSINAFFNINFPYESSFYAPLFLVLILFSSISNHKVASILSLKPLVTLGEISFAVYIMQIPVWQVVSRLLENLNISYNGILLIYIIVLLFVGYMMLKYIEKPINNYLRKKYA